MARVTLTEIQPGDSINLTTTNAMLTDILTKSATIDGENVRDGGLDERDFADDAVSLKPQLTSSPSKRILFSNATTSSKISTEAGSFPAGWPIPFQTSSHVVTGPFEYSQSDLTRLIVKFSCHYQTDKPAATGQTEWTFQMGYSTDWNGSTGTWQLLSSTIRRAAYRIGSNGLATANSLTIAHRFTASLTTTTLFFGMFVWDNNSGGADGIYIEGANLYGIVL